MVTDNTRDTTWNENPNTEKFIRNHPFFKGKTINDILYWNQDVVGDWSGLLKEGLIVEGEKENAAIEFIRHSIKGSQFENHVFLAGGIVRDEILGIEPHDIDVVVDIKDGGILFLTWLAKKHGIYKEQSSPVIFPTFGTAKLSLDGLNYSGVDLSGIDIEAVMTRGETYSDGSRKPEVHYDDLKTDTLRRDSTANSLLKNVSTGEILDLTGRGISDIKNGILRTPLDPDITFSDDPLRMMRFVRQSNKFGWKIDDEALEGIKRNASKLPNISNERIKDELTKILTSDTPVRGIRLLKDTGLLKYIIPEFEEAYEMNQNKYHDKSVWEHTLDVVSNTPPDLITRLQSLFHDLGKVKTRTVVDDNIHFFGHENFSSDMARQVLERLKFPNNIIDAVCIGVKNHMRLKRSGENGEIASDKSLRKFVVDLGDHLESTLTLMAADNSVHRGEYTNPNQIPGIRARIEKLKNTIPAKNSKLPVTGEDLKNLGLKQGPLFKELLDLVKDQQLENPNTSKEEYLDLIKAHLSSKS
jgi:tRNA nucleotidyltransferase/poly(A) polymerase